MKVALLTWVSPGLDLLGAMEEAGDIIRGRD
jgi:hypothetical protein